MTLKNWEIRKLEQNRLPSDLTFAYFSKGDNLNLP